MAIPRSSRQGMALITRLFYLAVLSLLVFPSSGKTSAGNSNISFQLNGKEIFQTNCSICHGRYGNSGISGAADLTVSAISFKDAFEIVQNGKGTMQAYGEQLSKKDIEAVVEYAISLRK